MSQARKQEGATPQDVWNFVCNALANDKANMPAKTQWKSDKRAAQKRRRQQLKAVYVSADGPNA